MTTQTSRSSTGAADHILAIELITGEQFFAEIVIVVDQPPTPDVFLLRVNREPDGAFTATSTTGESILLADIARVAPASPASTIPSPSSRPFRATPGSNEAVTSHDVTAPRAVGPSGRTVLSPLLHILWRILTLCA